MIEKQINSGLIIMYKGEGITSRDVVFKVGRTLKCKSGHIGTLDPKASGVLPILLGRSVKLSSYLIEKDKKYIVEMQFGITTDTLDLEGEITKKDDLVISNNMYLEEKKSEILEVLESFKGNSVQKTPIFSSRKVDGEKLYDIARKDVELARKKAEEKKKEITIYDISNVKFKENNMIEFEIHVSSGTYIRQVVEDVAEKLGTIAVMTKLERIQVSNMKKENSITLEKLLRFENNNNTNNDNTNDDLPIISEKEILENTEIPKLNLPSFRKKQFVKGMTTDVLKVFKGKISKDGNYLIYICNELFGIGNISGGNLKRKYILEEKLRITILELVDELFKYLVKNGNKKENLEEKIQTEVLQKEYFLSVIWEIIETVTKKQKKEYLKNISQKYFFEDSEIQQMHKMILEYLNGKPLAYITGKAYIYGNSIMVNENVLIPRYDSEILVYETVKEISKIIEKRISKVKDIKEMQDIQVLELCIGSGALSICVLTELAKKYDAEIISKINIVGTDISKKALKVARENILNYGLEKNIKLIQSDMFENLREKYYEFFDIVFSNPPYIAENEILEAETLKEPQIALFGGEDGLKYYNIIIGKICKYVKANIREEQENITCVLLEIGEKQKEALEKIANNNEFKMECIKDLASRDRVCVFKKIIEKYKRK